MWLKCKAGGVKRWRISCLFAPAVDLAHCSNNGKDEMQFFMILLPPWLLNALVDVQWTAAKRVSTCQQQQIHEVSVLWMPNYPKLGESAADTEQHRAERKDCKAWVWTNGSNSNNCWSQSPACFLNLGLSWYCLCHWWQCNGMCMVGRLHFWGVGFIYLIENKKWILTRGKEKLIGTTRFVCYSACRL